MRKTIHFNTQYMNSLKKKQQRLCYEILNKIFNKLFIERREAKYTEGLKDFSLTKPKKCERDQ